MSSEDQKRRERLAALGAKREIPTPEGEARMSAVILEVAEPLLKRHGKTPERAKAVIMLVVAGWNKALLPPDKQPALEKEIIDHLVPEDGSRGLCRGLCRWKGGVRPKPAFFSLKTVIEMLSGSSPGWKTSRCFDKRGPLE